MKTLLHGVFPRDLVALRRGLVSSMLAAWLGAAAVVAEPLFTAAPVPLSASPSEQASVIATLGVAARMDRLETSNEYHRVTLDGWARQGVDRVLFGLPGKRILVASVAKEQLGSLEYLGQTVDPETGIVWNRVRIEGWVPQVATEPRIDPIWNAAWELFSERCTACHQRRVPEHYTANQWRSLIKVMGPRTGLPKADQMRILTFLQYHARDTIDLAPGGGPAADMNAGR